MRKKLIILAIVLGVIGLIYYISTTQFGSRNFGGTYTVNLQDNKKLVNVTWKDNELWLLTRDARKDDIQENYKFSEDARYNMIEGDVVIKETLKK